MVGVLRDIDVSFDEKEIIDLFNGAFHKVIRMSRFDKITNTRMPTRSVKVLIESDELPEYVTAYGMRCRLAPFEQRLKMCFKCHKFGNFEQQCRAENKRCLNCGFFRVGTCDKTTSCSSCNGHHKFGDEKCPVRKIEQNVLQVMNNNKLSYFEAKDWIKANVSSEAFSCIVKNINFPTITENTEGKYKK